MKTMPLTPARQSQTPIKNEDRSKSILEAAFSEFARQGYAAARMEEIAKRAGVTKSLIYFYFSSKEALFSEVMRPYLSQVVADQDMEIKTSLSVAQQVVRAILRLYHQLLSKPLLPVAVRLILTEERRFDTMRRHYFEGVITPILNAFTGLLKEGVRRGEWPEENIAQITQLYVGPMVISIAWNFIFGDIQKIDTRKAGLEHVSLILRSLGLEPDKVLTLSELAFLDEQKWPKIQGPNLMDARDTQKADPVPASSKASKKEKPHTSSPAAPLPHRTRKLRVR